MTEGPIRTRKEGGILEVTIDRPKANAIDLATSRIMGDIFADFRDDPDMRVAILTAASEKFFCPGWDLKAWRPSVGLPRMPAPRFCTRSRTSARPPWLHGGHGLHGNVRACHGAARSP